MSSKLLGYMLLLVDVVGYNQEEMYIIYIYICVCVPHALFQCCSICPMWTMGSPTWRAHET